MSLPGVLTGVHAVRMIFGFATLPFALLAGGAASAQAISAGTYICTVEQRASISSTHLEGAGPPEASISTELYRFRIQVSENSGAFRIVEIPYDGPDESRFQWEDDSSTLHTAYVGDGRAFNSEEGPGFLNFNRDRWGPALQFYHSGYEYAGGEDQHLSVRWGRCTSEQRLASALDQSPTPQPYHASRTQARP